MRRLIPLLLLACSGTPPPTPDPLSGTALFRFNIADMVRNNTSRRMAKGTAYGNIYLSEDVSVTGPRTGAMEFGYVEIALDVESGISDVDGGSFTTKKLDPNTYTFLGFLDTNMNAGAAHDPDPGDFATLPMTNKFDITDGGQAKKTIVFDLIYN